MTYLDRKGSLAEYEALRLLRRQGYVVIRKYGDSTPPELFVACDDERFFLMVRSVGFADPGEEEVTALFSEDLRRFRDYLVETCIPKELWVLAPPARWTHFEVLAGGIQEISREWEHLGMNPGVPWKTNLRAEPLPGGRALYFRRRERARMRAMSPGYLHACEECP